MEENQNINLSRSSFADLRPPFVVPKAALTHRNCLCLYHENVCLLLIFLNTDAHKNRSENSSLRSKMSKMKQGQSLTLRLNRSLLI